jgi:hypothetical protein
VKYGQCWVFSGVLTTSMYKWMAQIGLPMSFLLILFHIANVPCLITDILVYRADLQMPTS